MNCDLTDLVQLINDISDLYELSIFLYNSCNKVKDVLMD